MQSGREAVQEHLQQAFRLQRAGRLNRRINVTLLFGRRAASAEPA